MEELSEEQANAAFWTVIAGAFSFCGVLALLVPAWAAFNHLPQLKPVSWALLCVTLLTSISAVPDALMRREMKFKYIAIRTLVGSAVGGAVGVTGALLGWGVWALVGQQLSSVFVYALTVWTVTPWRPKFPRPRAIFRGMKGMRRQSAHSLGGAFGVFVSSRMDVFVMGAFFVNPFMIGIYRFSLRLAELVVDVTSRGLQHVSLPALAEHQSDREQLGRRLASLVHVAVVMSVPALGVLAAVAKPLVLTIGPQWELAARPLQVLCVVSALGTVHSLLGPAMQAVQRASVPAIMTWVSAVLSVVGLGAAAWVSRGQSVLSSLLWVAIAALCVQAINLAVTAFLAYRVVLRISIWPTVRAVTPSLISAAAGFGAAWLMGHRLHLDPLPALLSGGAVGATVALAVLAALDGEMRRQGIRLTRRFLQRGRTPAVLPPADSLATARAVGAPTALMPTIPAPSAGPGASAAPVLLSPTLPLPTIAADSPIP
jgi:PST family polysaccharide transporter